MYIYIYCIDIYIYTHNVHPTIERNDSSQSLNPEGGYGGGQR